MGCKPRSVPQRIYYHFTAAHLIPGILKQGIRKGVLPWSMDQKGRVGMRAGWQWLTEASHWEQEWARPSPFSKLPWRRDEIRITVRFPDRFPGQLISWPEVDRAHRPDSADFINTFADARNWWLYYGAIPPLWFVAIEKNPTPAPLVVTDGN